MKKSRTPPLQRGMETPGRRHVTADSPDLHRVQGVARRPVHRHFPHDEHHDFSSLVIWQVSTKEPCRGQQRDGSELEEPRHCWRTGEERAAAPMVWMMAFCTMRSSLSRPRTDDTLLLEFLLEPSPSSKSTLIRRCLSSVLKTSRTVGPAVTPAG